MKLIGLTGASGAGKDTVAKYLATKDFVAVGFADPLKRFCAETLGVNHEILFGSSQQRSEIRKTLEDLGAAVRKNNPRGLIDATMAVVEAVQAGGHAYVREFGIIKTTCSRKHVLITDIRTADELDAVRKAGGEVWKIVRDANPLKGFLCDCMIMNTGSFEWLHWQIDKALERSHAH